MAAATAAATDEVHELPAAAADPAEAYGEELDADAEGRLNAENPFMCWG